MAGNVREERILPLGPLLEATKSTRTVLRKRLGISGSRMRAAAAEGLTLSEADRWALRSGFHPARVWGDDWLLPEDRPNTAA